MGYNNLYITPKNQGDVGLHGRFIQATGGWSFELSISGAKELETKLKFPAPAM